MAMAVFLLERFDGVRVARIVDLGAEVASWFWGFRPVFPLVPI